MENASKALIIAGAILLSILIIGLGMFIYQQASGAMGNANLDPQKIQAYNSEFTSYEGTRSGTQVRALLDVVRNHNLANTDDPSLNVTAMTGSAASVTTAPTALVTASAINDIKKTVTFDIPEIYRLSHTVDDKSLKYFDEETNIFNPISIKDGDKFRADYKKDAEQQDIEDGVLDYVHTKTQEKMEMIVHAKFDTYKDYKVKCNFTKQDTIKDKPKTNFAGKTIKE